MTEHQEKIFTLLLDVQKQIGDIGKETARQSEMLIALNKRVEIANGRTSKNESAIDAINKDIASFKSKAAGVALAVTMFGSLIITGIKQYFHIP